MPHSTQCREKFPIIKDVYDDWRDDLARDGYAIIKGAVSHARSEQYIQAMFEWLEHFPWGFDRNDLATWNEKHLPTHIRSGHT